MSDQAQDFLRCRPEDLRGAMSIHTRKITDSCRDKDCIEDLRVYLTTGSQSILENATSVRVRCAELLHTAMEVHPVAFDRSHYCIDVTFYYRILVDAVVQGCRPATLYGLSVFSKKVVLCGEDAKSHVYVSDRHQVQNNDPVAAVEVLDPMVLGSKLRDVCDCGCCQDPTPMIPQGIRDLFDEDLCMCSERRRLYVTLGQFSIIRLERDAQLVVPVLAYSIPNKECTDGAGPAEDPCEMFAKIPFPTAQFSPRDCDGKNPCRKC